MWSRLGDGVLDRVGAVVVVDHRGGRRATWTRDLHSKVFSADRNGLALGVDRLNVKLGAGMAKSAVTHQIIIN